MTEEDIEILSGLLDGLKPEPRLSVSVWAENNRVLSQSESASPGPWDNSLCPYLVEIMDNLSVNSPAQEVVVMKGAQLGFTEAANNLIGYVIDQVPSRVMMVQPTDAVAVKLSKTRIAPMIESTPSIAKKIRPARTRDSGNTTKLKQFPGGAFILAGANSPVSLRMISARFLILDEVDGYPEDLGNEGNPMKLAIARTRTYGRRAKIFTLSTPTIDGKSAIQTEFLRTDQRYFYVPCPHCGEYQRLEFKRLKWETGKPETVRYECYDCGELIEERFKTSMMVKGRWQSTFPENIDPKKVGYHLSSLYSPSHWFSWETIIRQWEEIQGNVNDLKTFVNTVLGEVWVEKGDSPEWSTVYNKRKDYAFNTINNDVYFITAGADVQADRIEVEIVGWGKDRISWSIDYRRYFGDTSQLEVWRNLTQLLNETWVRPDGIALPCVMLAVDSGFNTHTVYQFCRLTGGKAVPIKGQERQLQTLAQPRVVDVNFQGKKYGTVALWNLGVSILKKEFYGYLRLQILDDGKVPPGYCFFPMYNEEHFKGLTAETYTYVINKRTKRKRYEWVKNYERNEPLDCRIYARAAAAILGMDIWTPDEWEAVINSFGKNSEPQEKKERKKRRDSFW